MINVTKNGIILEKTKLGFEHEGVSNPAVIVHENSVIVLYRAVGDGNFSTIGYCKMTEDSTVIERKGIPIIFPQFDYETQGTEDPRVVKIGSTFYLTYTAYDGVNALGALATSSDLLTWEKKGVIVPQLCYHEFSRLAGSNEKLNTKYQRFNLNKNDVEKHDKKILLWDKNVILFPRKINDKYYFLHRIKPDIQLVSCFEFSDLTTEFWQNYLLHFNENILLTPKYDHESSYIGGGCPPIETYAGWLIIYHGVQDSINGYIYSCCVALLDIDNPSIELSRLPYPLFSPVEKWELKGEVNNVCFPTGAIVREDSLLIYYGAADERIASATVSISELINELIMYKNNDNK